MNLLEFLKLSIVNNSIVLSSHYIGKNRINNAGDALEHYIKDGFADCFSVLSESERLKAYDKYFSYSGNKNNPPDLILKNGDAVEIKKIESKGSALALNSSYPKSKLFANSPMITSDCRKCEDWIEKDLLYAVGYVKDNELHALWMVYGDCIAADRLVYEKIKNKISQGINEIPDVEFTETNELGKVKKVDPLGVTDLRIRGMWHIDNPIKIFDYLNLYNEEAPFQIICIMRKEKFDSFPKESRDNLSALSEKGCTVRDVEIKNPDNPAKVILAVAVTFRRAK
jgi:hypothetical protein